MAVNPRLILAERGIQRRLFLKAIALGLTVPFAMRLARMATAAPAGPKKRFMVIYVPHGIAPEHFNPKMAPDGMSFDFDKTNVSILAPLQPYKQSVNVYQGLSYVDNDLTHEGIVNCLSGTSYIDDKSPRITLEHVIAKGLGVKPLILGACSHQPYGINLQGKLFWDGTTHVDPEKSPVKVADTLFGGTSMPTVSDADLRAKVLELSKAETEDLRKSVTGLTSEDNKLTAFLQGLEAIRSGDGMGAMSCSGKPSLPSVEQVRAASAGIIIEPSGGNDYFYQEKNFPLLFKAQLDVAAQALICGAAPVIGLMPMYATCEFNFSSIIQGELGKSSGWSHHNGLSHTGHQAADGAGYNTPPSVANAKPEIRETFARAQQWFFKQIVDNLVSLLANTPDPTASNGSKVLDNTLIYIMSEIGDGADHSRVSYELWPHIPNYLPAITIGKCAGAMKTGLVPTYPILDKKEMSGRPAGDLYASMARAMGVAGATFPSTKTPVTEGFT